MARARRPVDVFQVAENARERDAVAARGREHRRFTLPAELEGLAARTVQHDLLVLRRELVPRRVDVKTKRLGDQCEVIDRELAVDEFAFVVERVQRSFAQRLLGILHEQLGRKPKRLAEPFTLRARATRAIEREQARFELGQRAVAVRATALRREQPVTVVAERDRAEAIA